MKSNQILIVVVVIAIVLFVAINARANSKGKDKGKPCKNGDGSTLGDGQNSYDQNGNKVGCHNGEWGVPN